MDTVELAILLKMLYGCSDSIEFETDQIGYKVNSKDFRFGSGEGKYWWFPSGILAINPLYGGYQIFWAPWLRKSYSMKFLYGYGFREIRKEQFREVYNETLKKEKEEKLIKILFKKLEELYATLPPASYTTLLTCEIPEVRKRAKNAFKNRKKWNIRLKNFLRTRIHKFVNGRRN